MSETKSKGEMWGCIGSVSAAALTGIFGIVVALISAGYLPNLGARLSESMPEVMRQELGPTQGDLSGGRAPGSEPGSAEIKPIDVGGQQAPSGVIEALATPNSGTASNPSTLPTGYGCPPDLRAGWLDQMSFYYGPYEGLYIAYDLYYFYVYDAFAWDAHFQTYGSVTTFSSAPAASARNSWQQLGSTPFWICIDSLGPVYSIYAP